MEERFSSALDIILAAAVRAKDWGLFALIPTVDLRICGDSRTNGPIVGIYQDLNIDHNEELPAEISFYATNIDS